MKPLTGVKILVPPALFPLGMSAALSLLGDLTLFASLVPRLESLALTLPQLGVLFSIHRLIRIPGNPLVGQLADRVGRRPLFISGMLLAVISTAGYGFSVGFVPFLVCRLAWGAAWALINTTGMTITMDISNDESRGKLAGVYNSWLWVGFALAPFLGGYLVDHLPFRQAMLLLAFFTGLGLIASYLFLPETLVPRVKNQPQPGSRLRQKVAGMISQARSLNWQAMIMMAVFLFAGEGLLLSTLSLLLTDRFGQQVAIGQTTVGIATTAGTLFMLRAVLAGIIGPLAGHLSDRCGRLITVTFSALLGAGSLIIILYAGSMTGILAGILLSALASAAGNAVLTAWMGDNARRDAQGATFGWFAMIGDIGSALGPMLALFIYPLAGIAPAYWVGVILFALSAAWLNSSRLTSKRTSVSVSG